MSQQSAAVSHCTCLGFQDPGLTWVKWVIAASMKTASQSNPCCFGLCVFQYSSVGEKLAWFIRHLFDGLYIFHMSKFVKSPIKHLGIAIGNVRCVRRFSPTLVQYSCVWPFLGFGPWNSSTDFCLLTWPKYRSKTEWQQNGSNGFKMWNHFTWARGYNWLVYQIHRPIYVWSVLWNWKERQALWYQWIWRISFVIIISIIWAPPSDLHHTCALLVLCAMKSCCSISIIADWFLFSRGMCSFVMLPTALLPVRRTCPRPHLVPVLWLPSQAPDHDSPQTPRSSMTISLSKPSSARIR